MARSFLRQETQIRNSDAYTDNLAAGIALESGATSIEDDLNGLRSQAARFIDVVGSPNWYDDIPTVNSKQRALLQLNTDLDDLEEKKLLCRANVLTDVTVSAGENWVLLSVAGSETPTQVAAVATTTNGAVVAQSAQSGVSFNGHELVELPATSGDATRPRNLCVVRDAASGQPVQSSGRDVFGLLQYESTGVDGAAFNDLSGGNRAKISFVRLNATLDDLEACPVADIQNSTVNYSYIFRTNLDALPEDCLLGDGSFVDQAAAVDVTLLNAIANQGTAAAPVPTDINIDVSDGNTWNFRDVNQLPLLSISSDTVGSGSTVAIPGNVDSLDVDAVAVDIASGVTVASGGTAIAVGVTPGVIGTTGAADTFLRAGQELFLDDINQAGSTWAQTDGIKLSETTAEWSAFETAFGEVSLLNAIVAAGASGSASRTKVVGTVTSATIAADTDVSGPSGAGNLDADLANYFGTTFTDDVDIYVNGQLQYNAPNATANNDVYPGTDQTIGELRFEYELRLGDVITMIVWT